MQKLTRRTFLAATGAATLLPALRADEPRPKVVVVGAGAFGGWTALHLQAFGADVTLVDAWGAGHSRSSSGGETRVIRTIYGGDPDYTHWVIRSAMMWRQAQREWGETIYHRNGALWMFQGDDDYAARSVVQLEEAGLPIRRVTAEEAKKRMPAVDFTGVSSIYHEAEAGFLLARRSCARVVSSFEERGGRFIQSRVIPPTVETELRSIRLESGESLAADRFVFACGPWLGTMFPDVVGNAITPTRQEVFFFGTPSGRELDETSFPVWVDFGERLFYGVPGNQNRGFKIADDTRGEPFDPTSGERLPSKEGLERVRTFLGRRFPVLADAPLVESRVCQYENSPDGHFIIDRHPRAANLLLLGGGSGHGFKLGPALGEHVAEVVVERRDLKERFRLARFEAHGSKTRTQLQGE